MKLEIGKLYKIKFERPLYNKEFLPQYNTTTDNIEAYAIFLLLDIGYKKIRCDFNRYKILTPDGSIGWIVTGMNAESLFTAIS